MNEFDRVLSERLAVIHEQGLHRELRCIESAQGPRIQVSGRSLLNFSSNDYLGLANEPALKRAALEALNRYGAGAGASRLICGSLAPHRELDDTLADFKGTEAALAFSSSSASRVSGIASHTMSTAAAPALARPRKLTVLPK